MFRTIDSTPVGTFIRGLGNRITSLSETEPNFIAVASNLRMMSSIDGITWNTVSQAIFTDTIYDVTSGFRRDNNNFVWIAVGKDNATKGELGKSSTGTSWTSADTPQVFGTKRLIGVGFGYEKPDKSLWVVCGYDGIIGYSQNADNDWALGTWTNAQPTTKIFYRVKYGLNGNTKEGLWIAVGTNKLLAKSSNGKDWETIDMDSISVNPIAINSVAYNDGLWAICTGEGKILTSTDGTNWSMKFDIKSIPSTLTTNIDFYDISYGDNRWVTVGYDTEKESGTLAVSTDGETWNTYPSNNTDISHEQSFQDSIIYAITYKEKFWVAAGDSYGLGTPKLASGYIFWN